MTKAAGLCYAGGMRRFVFLAALTMAGCSAAPPESRETTVEPQAAYSSAEHADRDLYEREVNLSGEFAGRTYDDFDEARSSAGLSFAGYRCVGDCEGHRAGYDWAEERGISDESECGGHSWSFREGCIAYADEQSGEGDGDDYGDEE